MNELNAVSLGGMAVGLGLLIYRVYLWWPKKINLKSLRLLAPFIFAWLYGMLLILCAGGLLGWIADIALWGSNWVGDGVLVYGVGGQHGDNITRGGGQALTNGGHLMVLLLTALVVAMVKKRSVDTVVLWQGILSGVCLGLVKGVAGAAAVPLATAVNLAGAWASTRTLS